MKYYVTDRSKVYHLVPRQGVGVILSKGICGVRIWNRDDHYDKKPHGFKECKNCTKGLNKKFLDKI